jgi:hypothetical protein
VVTQRQKKVILIATVVFVAIWVVAITGYVIARNAKVTVEKVASTLQDTDLAGMSAEERSQRLKKLAGMLNALGFEDRRRARIDGEWNRLFKEMTDAEKTQFLEDTLPTGFKQMMTAFEQMPEDKRQRAINDAVKRMKKAREEQVEFSTLDGGKERPGLRSAELSPELQEKVVKMGLNSFYKDSSAQTKAELAPFMEELQKTMENGRLFRR